MLIESMSVLVPSRGRPEAMAKLADRFQATCQDSTILHWIIDSDDEALPEYRAAYDESTYQFQAIWVVPKGPPGIVHPLNAVIDDLFHPQHGFYPTILAFLGDDFNPRTPGWDLKIEQQVADAGGTAIVYGNDLLQKERLCTAWFVSLDIVHTLGHLAPRELRHLYVDNFWMDLGKGADCLYYLPDVILEHMHPDAGKAEWDATYQQNNNSRSAAIDRAAYQQFVRSGKLARDIERVKRLKEAD